MISYYIYWKNGKKETVRGTTLTNALRRSGYAPSRVKDIELYSTRNDPSIKWIGGEWIKTKKKEKSQ